MSFNPNPSKIYILCILLCINGKNDNIGNVGWRFVSQMHIRKDILCAHGWQIK